MNLLELLRAVNDLIKGEAPEQSHRDSYIEEKEQNRKLLKELDSDDEIIDNLRTYSRFDSESAWQSFMNKNNISAPKRKISLQWLRLTAAVALFMSLGTVIYFFNSKPDNKLAIVTPIYPGSETAIFHIGEQCSLNLSDSLTTKVEEGAEVVASINKGQITYNPSVVEPVQMTVEVPIKAEYHFSLSDGTKVWMNANSKITFSHPFSEESRNVYAQGEVYFEVSKDEDRPFIVNLPNSHSIKVLGTQFCINTYNQEKEQKTVLIEGSILWRDCNGEEYALKPDQILTANQLNQQIEINDTDNIYPYIAWRDKRFLFEAERLENIMQSLSHWYGVTFTFQDENVKNLRFSVDVKRYEHLNKILEILELTNKVGFTINESEIRITKK